MPKKYIVIIQAFLLIFIFSFSTYYFLAYSQGPDREANIEANIEATADNEPLEIITVERPEEELIEKENGAEVAQEKKQPLEIALNQPALREEAPVTTAPSRSQPVEQRETPTPTPPATNASRDFNRYVLDIIKTYDFNNISYPYLVNNDYANYNGVTTTLSYQGRTLARAHPSGNRASHCVGITFEVFYKAWQERNRQLGKPAEDFNGLSFQQMHNFMLNWYVAGPKKDNNVAVAVEKYGFGRRYTNLEEARPGDFMDFSRENHTGHTVVFLEWIRDNGKIVGLRYWSSQESTRGIGYRSEYFNVRNGDRKYGNVMLDSLYMARVN